MSFLDEIDNVTANAHYLAAMHEARVGGGLELRLRDFGDLGTLDSQTRRGGGDAAFVRVLRRPLGVLLLDRFLAEDCGLHLAADFLRQVEHFRTLSDEERRPRALSLLQQLRSISALGKGCQAPLRSRASLPYRMNTASLLVDRLGELHREIEQAIGLEVPDPAAFDRSYSIVREQLMSRLYGFVLSDNYRFFIQCIDYIARPVHLADFLVFRVLGTGAFGVVSGVQKRDTKALFAMKELNKKQVVAEGAASLCVSERRILAKIRSPFVVRLHYAFEDAATLYLVMGLCSGGDLKYHLSIAPNGHFDVARARFYAAQVLLGLRTFRAMGYAYRDVKPENMLLDDKGHVKISDLGLTVKLPVGQLLRHVAGTAGYWAPEVVSRTATLPWSDLWGWGVMLYEMLCGNRPRCRCRKGTEDWCPFSQHPSMMDNARKAGRKGLYSRSSCSESVGNSCGREAPPVEEGGCSPEELFRSSWTGSLVVSLDFNPQFFSPEARDLLERVNSLDFGLSVVLAYGLTAGTAPGPAPATWMRRHGRGAAPPVLQCPRLV